MTEVGLVRAPVRVVTQAPPSPPPLPPLLMQQNNLHLPSRRILPTPEELEGLAPFIPNVGERFMAGWEEQRRHRMRIEFLFALYPYATLLGAVVVIVLLALLSYSLIRSGDQLAGTIFGGVDLAGIASAILVASTRKNDRKTK